MLRMLVPCAAAAAAPRYLVEDSHSTLVHELHSKLPKGSNKSAPLLGDFGTQYWLKLAAMPPLGCLRCVTEADIHTSVHGSRTSNTGQDRMLPKTARRCQGDACVHVCASPEVVVHTQAQPLIYTEGKGR